MPVLFGAILLKEIAEATLEFVTSHQIKYLLSGQHLCRWMKIAISIRCYKRLPTLSKSAPGRYGINICETLSRPAVFIPNKAVLSVRAVVVIVHSIEAIIISITTTSGTSPRGTLTSGDGSL